MVHRRSEGLVMAKKKGYARRQRHRTRRKLDREQVYKANRMVDQLVAKSEATARWRRCAGCTACCTVMGIPDLSPEFEDCKHIDVRPKGQLVAGCGIYKDRPDDCRDFQCLWLQGLPMLEDGDRPDMLGVVYAHGEWDRDKDLMIVQAYEFREGAASSARARAINKVLRNMGYAVVVINVKKHELLIPLTVKGKKAWEGIKLEVNRRPEGTEAKDAV